MVREMISGMVVGNVYLIHIMGHVLLFFCEALGLVGDVVGG